MSSGFDSGPLDNVMQVDIGLMVVGVALCGFGVIVLICGKNSSVSFEEITGMGRKVFEDLPRVFSKRSVVAFKLLAYLGLTFVLGGIGMALYL